MQNYNGSEITKPIFISIFIPCWCIFNCSIINKTITVVVYTVAVLWNSGLINVSLSLQSVASSTNPQTKNNHRKENHHHQIHHYRYQHNRYLGVLINFVITIIVDLIANFCRCWIYVIACIITITIDGT